MTVNETEALLKRVPVTGQFNDPVTVIVLKLSAVGSWLKMLNQGNDGSKDIAVVGITEVVNVKGSHSPAKVFDHPDTGYEIAGPPTWQIKFDKMGVEIVVQKHF